MGHTNPPPLYSSVCALVFTNETTNCQGERLEKSNADNEISSNWLLSNGLVTIAVAIEGFILDPLWMSE